jgi:hypothetical protein
MRSVENGEPLDDFGMVRRRHPRHHGAPVVPGDERTVGAAIA